MILGDHPLISAKKNIRTQNKKTQKLRTCFWTYLPQVNMEPKNDSKARNSYGKGCQFQVQKDI